MENVKKISIRYLIFSSICLTLIATNMIIDDITAWLIIDIILIIVLANRVTENYRVSKELKEYLKKYSPTDTGYSRTVKIQKVSQMFSILFAVCLALVSSNMVIGSLDAWLIIDIILLTAFSISIVVRYAIIKTEIKCP